MQLTIKLKLEGSAELLLTMKKYTGALNHVSMSAFSNGGSVRNAMAMHRHYYREIREKFSLPSQMACSVFKDIAGRYKAAHKRGGKPDKAVNFKERHINYVYNRDFSVSGDRLSLLTVNGRKKYKLYVSEYQRTVLGLSVKYCDSTVSVDKKGRFYLNLVIEVPEAEIREKENTMGIDVGLSKLAVASTNIGRTLVIPGGRIKEKRRKFLRLRKKLQSKGTRSAKKLLRKLSGRENRWMRDVNYRTVKKLLNFAAENNVSHIGIEDLTGIRKSKTGKEQRRELNSWAFYQFRSILEYKARLNGIVVTALNPQYTSQACCNCGHTEKSNRKTQKLFVCRSCNYRNNADINASANIEFLTRLLRFNLIDLATVNSPNVTGVDAKGLFSQLRRSPVTSLPACLVGS